MRFEFGEILKGSSKYIELLNKLESNKNCSCFGLNLNEISYILSSIKKQKILVVNTISDAFKYETQLKSLGLKTYILSQKIENFTFSEFNGDSFNNLLLASFKLLTNEIDVLICLNTTLLQKLISPKFFKENIISFKKGSTLNFNNLSHILTNLNYKRVEEITSKGEYVLKGDILNIYPINSDFPVRVSFFDEEIEKIVYFSLETYGVLSETDEFLLCPNTFYFYTDEDYNKMLTEIKNSIEKSERENTKKSKTESVKNEEEIENRQKTNKKVENLSENSTNLSYFDENYLNLTKTGEQNENEENTSESCDNLDNKSEKLKKLLLSIENRTSSRFNSAFIIPFVQNFNASILDYLFNGVVVFLEPKLALDAINTEYVNFLSSLNTLCFEGALLPIHKNVVISKNDIFKTSNTCCAFLNLNTSNKIFESEYVSSFLSNFTKNYNQNFSFLLSDIKNLIFLNYQIILCADTSEKAIKLQEFLKENEVFASVFTNLNQIKDSKVSVLVSTFNLGATFVEDRVIVFGNYNIYGNKKAEIEDSKVKKVFFTPKLGDFVVHETHGICKCKAIEKVTFSNITKDYIVLEFFGGDTLYLPTEKTNLITKFIGENESPKLNKLGSTEFLKEKTKVKAKVREMAFDLLKLYAKREATKGFKFVIDDSLQAEFENAFPYELSPDQEKAVKELKEDMQSDKVMDRLICGDVGYGKTEVALRGAFKAVLSGKQVAFLSPTTILSEQHFKTCLARMKSFMVNVEVLNRFKSAKEVKRILADLKAGKIDVICGTHRLLSKDVEFKDLGLLVLDEEQRFGVEDKEKIKNLKNNIDVLTLSATPIPRTLHMSLMGVRDISIIDTPPKNRIPVQTVVTEYNAGQVKEAITRELNRGGQVLIVYNRVESINQFAQSIKNMFPDTSLAISHGQMPQRELENVINRVYLEEVQILVSTVLIENGIDLPKANTIIIVNSDKLGLSQLYQLRGRVGRSDRNAYAYFTYASHQALTEEGYKRLSALSEFSSLGSGFKIAMRDLEIRGAGNILGKEQSGHIEKVGYDMYTKILKEAVLELKGEKLKEEKDCKMEVSLSSFIPKDYIESDENRIKVYEEISSLNSFIEKYDLEKMLTEKFGQIPSEIGNLMLVALLKNLLVKLNAKRFVLNQNKCFIEFYDKNDLVSDKISKIISQNKKTLRLNITNLPIIEIITDKPLLEKLKFVANILS